jgi:drug/metabolite transporter (DMT)-like permease
LSAATPTAAPRSAPGRHGLMHWLMLLATLSWAGNMIAGKQALREIPPLALALFRVGGAALILLAAFFAWLGFRRGGLGRPKLGLTGREWGRLIILSLFGIALNQIFFIGGLARTSVAHTGLLVALGPVMVLMLSVGWRLEALTRAKVAGMLLSFAGVAILTSGRFGGGGGGWTGDLIVLASSAVFAVYTVLLKKVADRYDALTLNALTYALGAILLIPVCGKPFVEMRWRAVTGMGWFGALYMVVLGSVISYLIFAFALTELAASRVAAFSYLQPVIATGLAIWLLAEKLTGGVVAGGALILGGVYLAERERGEETAR